MARSAPRLVLGADLCSGFSIFFRCLWRAPLSATTTSRRSQASVSVQHDLVRALWKALGVPARIAAQISLVVIAPSGLATKRWSPAGRDHRKGHLCGLDRVRSPPDQSPSSSLPVPKFSSDVRLATRAGGACSRSGQTSRMGFVVPAPKGASQEDEMGLCPIFSFCRSGLLDPPRGPAPALRLPRRRVRNCLMLAMGASLGIVLRLRCSIIPTIVPGLSRSARAAPTCFFVRGKSGRPSLPARPGSRMSVRLLREKRGIDHSQTRGPTLPACGRPACRFASRGDGGYDANRVAALRRLAPSPARRLPPFIGADCRSAHPRPGNHQCAAPEICLASNISAAIARMLLEAPSP